MTPEQTARLVTYLETHDLSKGVGTEESACMVASINLAIDGKLTDKIPECMSLAIGRWGIIIQDAMPEEMRNSREFKALIPLAAGTGRNLEKQRAAIALDWMWTKVLPQLQPIANNGGFGDAWAKMLKEKTAFAATKAAKAATKAAKATTNAAYATSYAATAASNAATYAAKAAAEATFAATHATTYATYATASAAALVADATTYAAALVADADFWQKADPISCLKQMIEVTA